MKGKKLAAKIMLGLLLATPYGFAEANSIGSVTVDGEEKPVDVSTIFTIGNETVNTVEITNDNGYSIDILDKTNGTINGKEITLNGGVEVYHKTMECGTVTIGNNITDTVTINGGATDGIVAVKGHVIVTADTINISTDSDGGYGAIWVQNNTDTPTAPENAASVTLNGENINIKSNGLGLVAFSNGQLNINGNLTASAPELISVRGHSTVNINAEGKYTTKLDGDIEFNITDDGNSGLKSNAYVNIKLTDSNSYFNGNIVKTYATEKGDDPATGLDKMTVENMNLEISNGAQWNPDNVDEFAEDKVDKVEEGIFASAQEMLAVDNLTSNGGIINLENMGDQTLEVENITGDDLTVNVASSNNKLAFTESNSVESLTVAANGAYAEELVQNDIADSLNNLANQVVDNSKAGNGKTAATDVAISETGVVGEITAQVGEDGKVDATTVKELTNSTTAGIGELANVAFMAWRAENDEMHQRMGELRSSTGEAGIWARMKRGESESGDLNIKNQYSTYQLGYDEKVGDSNWYLGGAISRTEGKSSFGNGSGENQSTGFTVYGTYVGDDGQYVDLSAKYARLDNEFDVFGRDGIESTGDYRNNGYAFSAEYGKRIETGNEFWVEPQVQLTYGHLSSANYTTSRGIKAAQDAMDSIVGRVGFAAGKDIGAGNVYVKASYLYDFDGDTSVTMNDGVNSRTYEQDLGGGWFEFGIGTNINLSETSHLYFDVERAVGGDIDTPWQWNAGVRFDF